MSLTQKRVLMWRLLAALCVGVAIGALVRDRPTSAVALALIAMVCLRFVTEARIDGPRRHCPVCGERGCYLDDGIG